MEWVVLRVHQLDVEADPLILVSRSQRLPVFLRIISSIAERDR